MTAKDDITNYDSLYSWRHSNNVRQGSFKNFLIKMTKVFHDSNQVSVSHITITPRVLSFSDFNGRRSRRSIPIQEVMYGSSVTHSTPKRKVAAQYNHDAVVEDVQKRRKTCLGNIVFRVAINTDGILVKDGAGARGTCVNCGKKTHFFCMDCKHFLCGPNTEFIEGNLTKAVVRYAKLDGGGRIYFRTSCWHYWHEEAITNAYKVVK